MLPDRPVTLWLDHLNWAVFGGGLGFLLGGFVYAEVVDR